MTWYKYSYHVTIANDKKTVLWKQSRVYRVFLIATWSQVCRQLKQNLLSFLLQLFLWHGFVNYCNLISFYLVNNFYKFLKSPADFILKSCKFNNFIYEFSPWYENCLPISVLFQVDFKIIYEKKYYTGKVLTFYKNATWDFLHHISLFKVFNPYFGNNDKVCYSLQLFCKHCAKSLLLCFVQKVTKGF